MTMNNEEQFDFYWKEIFDGLPYNPIEFNVYRFDQSMSLPSKFNKLYEMFKVLALNNQEVMNYLKEFMETFDFKLETTIKDILIVWLNEGLLADVVREAINEEVVEARTDYLDHTYLDLKERLDLERKEVVLARGGSQTLGERLDSEKSEVSARLTQLSHITQFIEDFEEYNTESGYWDGAVREALKNTIQLKFSTGTYKFRNPIIFNGWNRAIEGSKNYMGGSTIFEFDGSGLFFATGTRYTSVRNITLKGTANIGVGIQFGVKENPMATDVHFVDIDNVNVTDFEVGIETNKNYDNTDTPNSIVWNSSFKNMRVEHCNVGYKANNSGALSFGLIFEKVYFNENIKVLILSSTQANFEGCNFGIRYIDSFDIKDNSNIYFNNCNFECDSVVQGTGAIFNFRAQHISFENSMLLMRGLSTVNVFATYSTLVSLTFQTIRYTRTSGNEMVNDWSSSKCEAGFIGSIQFLGGTKTMPKPINWGALYKARYRDMDNDILTNWSNANTGNYAPSNKGQMVYHTQKNIPVVHDGSNLKDFMGNLLDGDLPIKIANNFYLDGGSVTIAPGADVANIVYNRPVKGILIFGALPDTERLKVEQRMSEDNATYTTIKIWRFDSATKLWVAGTALGFTMSWLKVSK